jgi:hypothetical protein
MTTIISIALSATLLLLVNPFMIWMPSMMLSSVLAIICALVFVWAGFVLTEKATDEREEAHRTFAGRSAYLACALVLTLALIVQGVSDHIDPWIPLSLFVMVVTKMVATKYARSYK